MEAFTALFEPLRSTVYAVAVRLVGDSDAEDVVMETYLKAWQAIPRFGGRSSLKTWLYRIARNCALDCLRARKRREGPTPFPDDERDPVAEIPDRRPRPDEAAVSADAAARVRSALAALSDEHRATLLLRFADGLSYSEIAAATGVSIGTVMSRLFNGKGKLRGIFERETNDK